MSVGRLLHVVLGAILLGSAFTAGPADAATRPYAGAWAGGPASCESPFRFGFSTYQPPGGKPRRVARAERAGSRYELRFSDGYRVSLAMRGTDNLTWHSPASGDTFELKRCKR